MKAPWQNKRLKSIQQKPRNFYSVHSSSSSLTGVYININAPATSGATRGLSITLLFLHVVLPERCKHTLMREIGGVTLN